MRLRMRGHTDGEITDAAHERHKVARVGELAGRTVVAGWRITAGCERFANKPRMNGGFC